MVDDVLDPDLIGDVAAARNPISPRPQMLTPIAFSQCTELALAVCVNFAPSDIARREIPTGWAEPTAAYAHDPD